MSLDKAQGNTSVLTEPTGTTEDDNSRGRHSSEMWWGVEESVVVDVVALLSWNASPQSIYTYDMRTRQGFPPLGARLRLGSTVPRRWLGASPNELVRATMAYTRNTIAMHGLEHEESHVKQHAMRGPSMQFMSTCVSNLCCSPILKLTYVNIERRTDPAYCLE